ncbi:hypothetical protein ACQKM1_22605 [Peribacillus frigoritolerans]|uniref:hypothetical protein n=1 Tax=Peribacillus frigoritolerans TaxID=450367 RepID=UPI003D00B057
MNDSQQQLIKNQELALNNEGFLEHLTDHLIIAFSFANLGLLIGAYLVIRACERIKFDYTLDEGVILRVPKNKKIWLVTNPTNAMQRWEILCLSLFNIGKGQTVCQSEKRRCRIILYIIGIISLISILSGVILILSAAEKDLNIFNYM